MNKELPEYPTERMVGDGMLTVGRVLTGLMPLVSVPATELLNFILTPPLEKRRTEWLQEIGSRLKELEKKGSISLEELYKNETFIDITLQATQVALRTSQFEKKEALKNAILHSTIPQALEVSLQQMFIGYIDAFSVWHIKILDFFSDPARWAQKNNHNFREVSFGGLGNLLEETFPELRGRPDLYDQVWKDLYSRGLVNTDGLHTMMSGHGLMGKRASPIGEMFISYISQ